MRVAIPVFGTRVAPRFDFAPALIEVTVEMGVVADTRIANTIGLTPRDRIRLIRDLDVEVLICGGLDQYTAQILSGMPLQLYTWITGDVEDVVKQYLSGRLRSRAMLKPTRQRKRRRRSGSHKAGMIEMWQHSSRRDFSLSHSATAPSLEAEGQDQSEILIGVGTGTRDGRRAGRGRR